VLIAIALSRTGLHLFNREELLGRELDALDLRWAWRTYKRAFLAGASGPRAWLAGVFRSSLPRLRWGAILMVGALLVAYLIGVKAAARFTLPPQLFHFDAIGSQVADRFTEIGFFSGRGWLTILLVNVRALLLATALGIFSFGVLAVVLLMAPIALIGYFAGNATLAGVSAPKLLLAMVAPHAILELPAAILAGAAILELGMSLMRPGKEGGIGSRWLGALAEWSRIGLAVVLPLLIAAAALESFVTPRVMLSMFGGGP
jgi:stage II sporulation protein M